MRVPAAWNDLVGLKTTHGLLSLDGIVPLCPRFDTIGPLCRSVEDAGQLIAAMAGTAAPVLDGATTRGLRLGIVANPALQSRPGPLAAFEAALERIEAAGADVAPLPLPFLEAMLSLAGCLFSGEAYGVWREEIEARPEAMFPPIRDRFRIGAKFSAADFVDGWRKLDAHRAAWADATSGCDAVLMPTTPNLPPNAERLLADADHFAEENVLTLRNTRIANMMGLCALTLPTGMPGCGLMVMAPAHAEARLLRIGVALERAFV